MLKAITIATAIMKFSFSAIWRRILHWNILKFTPCIRLQWNIEGHTHKLLKCHSFSSWIHNFLDQIIIYARKKRRTKIVTMVVTQLYKVGWFSFCCCSSACAQHIKTVKKTFVFFSADISKSIAWLLKKTKNIAEKRHEK